MKLIVGLGNPGKEYVRTRHNVGFLAIDHLAGDAEPTTNKKLLAAVLKTELDNKRVVLAKPTTYMNSSGEAVQAILNFYKLTPNDLIVIHDDKDIPLGETRVQRDRGAAGHNGIKSIIEHIGTKDFTRIRVGVAPKDAPIHNTADFVLAHFTSEEQKALKVVFDHIKSEVHKLLLPTTE